MIGTACDDILYVSSIGFWNLESVKSVNLGENKWLFESCETRARDEIDVLWASIEILDGTT